MKLVIDSPRGMVPRQTDALLSPNNASLAENCFVGRGDLRAYYDSSEIASSVTAAASLYKYINTNGTHYLTDTSDRDYVESPIDNDQYERLYFSGEAEPRVYCNDLDIGVDSPDYYILGITQPVTTTPDTSITVAGAGAAEDRIYAYTFVSKYGEESAPSNISALVAGAKDDSTVEIFKIEAVPPGRQLDTLRIYRTATGNTNIAQFYFVKDYSLPTIEGNWASGSSSGNNGEYWQFDDGSDDIIYKCVNNGTTADPDDVVHGIGGSGVIYWEYYAVSDAVTTATMLATGIICPSEGYLPPPAGLSGLIRHSSGAMVGFKGNTLYFSEPFLPHAWPTEYETTVGFTIVGIGSFGSSIVVCTEGKPSLVIGDTPASMREVPLPNLLPCVSKRMVTSSGNAVYYAGTTGLVMVTQNGAQNVSLSLYARAQWAELVSAATFGVFFANKYFCFGVTNFVIDFDTDSTVTISGNYFAAHVSLSEGNLYLVEARAGVYTVRLWEGDTANLKQYVWRSKEFLGSLVNWTCAKVSVDSLFYESYLEDIEDAGVVAALNAVMIAGLTMGGSFGDDPIGDIPIAGTNLFSIASLTMSGEILFELYADGELKFSKDIELNEPFKLPGKYKCRKTYVKLSGYLPIDKIEVATSMVELLNAAS